MTCEKKKKIQLSYYKGEDYKDVEIHIASRLEVSNVVLEVRKNFQNTLISTIPIEKIGDKFVLKGDDIEPIERGKYSGVVWCNYAGGKKMLFPVEITIQSECNKRNTLNPFTITDETNVIEISFSEVVTQNISQTLSFESLTPQQILQLKGEQGIQGLQGEKGEKGDAGYTPIKGIDYSDGEKGEKGEKGDKGDTGEQGLQGIQGEKGEKGDTGELPNLTSAENIVTYDLVYSETATATDKKNSGTLYVNKKLGIGFITIILKASMKTDTLLLPEDAPLPLMDIHYGNVNISGTGVRGRNTIIIEAGKRNIKIESSAIGIFELGGSVRTAAISLQGFFDVSNIR